MQSEKILVISDIHLGSPVLRADALLELLDKKWQQIIVNGDLLDSGKFHRYTKKHWKILSKLRKISKHTPVRLIEGNHDREARVLVEILGLEYLSNLTLEIGLRKILFVHGDQFDSFISKHPIITEVAANIYYMLQRMGLSKSLCRKIKESSKQWMDASEILANRSLAHIAGTDITDICVGHSHHATSRSIPYHNYWNSGTFCDDPSNYLVICTNTGSIQLLQT